VSEESLDQLRTLKLKDERNEIAKKKCDINKTCNDAPASIIKHSTHLLFSNQIKTIFCFRSSNNIKKNLWKNEKKNEKRVVFS
jgi:hypothetical protein